MELHWAWKCLQSNYSSKSLICETKYNIKAISFKDLDSVIICRSEVCSASLCSIAELKVKGLFGCEESWESLESMKHTLTFKTSPTAGNILLGHTVTACFYSFSSIEWPAIENLAAKLWILQLNLINYFSTFSLLMVCVLRGTGIQTTGILIYKIGMHRGCFSWKALFRWHQGS